MELFDGIEHVAIRAARERALAVLKADEATLERGLALHRRILAVDGFCFLPYTFPEAIAQEWNELKRGQVGERETRWRIQLRQATSATRDCASAALMNESLRVAGLGAMVQTVAEGKSREEDIKRMATSRQVLRVFRHALAQAGSTGEIREIAASGRTAVLWSVNGPPLVGGLVDRDEEFSWLPTWYNLGVRLMHLTYNRRNTVGDGCAEPADAGLSLLGRELVEELNRVGILVDTAHTGRRSTLEAADISSRPILASHTGAAALCEHIRMKSDEELLAIARGGGVIGVLGLPQLLGARADLSMLLDHVCHIAELCGPEHVMIGTDNHFQLPWPESVEPFENSRWSPRWWGGWTAETLPFNAGDEGWAGSLAWTNWPLFAVGLLQRGFTDTETEGILGANFLRALESAHPEDQLRSNEVRDA